MVLVRVLFVPNIPQQISSKYILKNELGKGAYGTVYLGVDRFTGEELEFFSVLIGRVAVKRINDVFRTKTDAKLHSSRDHNSSPVQPSQYCNIKVDEDLLSHF